MGKKKEQFLEKLNTIKKDLGHKQRFVIIDSETFRERWSFQLSAKNLFVAVGLSVIVLVVLTTILIAFTPLREYIPGYMQTDLMGIHIVSQIFVTHYQILKQLQKMLINYLQD